MRKLLVIPALLEVPPVLGAIGKLEIPEPVGVRMRPPSGTTPVHYGFSPIERILVSVNLQLRFEEYVQFVDEVIPRDHRALTPRERILGYAASTKFRKEDATMATDPEEVAEKQEQGEGDGDTEAKEDEKSEAEEGSEKAE